ncbi:MAG: sodium-dependent transporter [Planctomycetes bacterium]|nr:sodium-dependent transporter [Planctomycetota bacterium]
MAELGQFNPDNERSADGWTSRRAFILASVASAIGLGNLWRFPFVCYEGGGGAFLFVYLIAMLTAGIPLMILEFGLGHMMNSSAPRAFARVKKGVEWVGWLAILCGFVLVTYYAVIMVWSTLYVGYSFNLSWGKDTEGFFFNTVLNKIPPTDILSIGTISWLLIGILFAMWIWIILSIWKGAKTVSKVVYVTATVPIFILIIFVIRGLTLPGAVDGLRYLLTPDFSKMLDPKVWIAAYGQVFFSLSIGFGIMIAYASFLPRKSDIVNNAFIVCLGDTAFSFLGSLAVFSALGYLAHETGKSVAEVAKCGPSLMFVTYPAIISTLPLGPLFGVLFFVMLVFLAIDSAFSLVEAFTAGVLDKWAKNRPLVNIIIGIIGFGAGILFTTQSGLYWLDIVDHFNSEVLLIIVGILECLVIGYVFGTGKIRKYVNELSEFRIGKWWDAMIMFIAPAMLAVMGTLAVLKQIKEGYEGYLPKALFLGGWLMLIVVAILAVVFSLIKGRKEE